jgi:two-component system chemotaxis sensor kinase CheA
MIRKALGKVVLPSEISAFERQYLTRMNRIGFWFFLAHVPALTLIALFNQTGPLAVGALACGVVAGPALALLTFENPRAVSVTYGFTAMLMGGVLVHAGQGPVQIEMHFYFFALLAMLAIYGNPLVIVTAAVTVALHHLVLWLVLPASVFNYDAPLWVVAVHAAFVVLESVATCYIARSFFDNVIGLERIVQARTAQLDARNRDMRLVLDHVDQGLLTIDRTGVISPEHSAILQRWLGPIAPGTTFSSYLARCAPVSGEMFEVGFGDVLDGFLPLEVTVGQLPRRFAAEGRSFDVEYTPIVSEAGLEKLLIVISDVTIIVERERLEAEQSEMVKVFDHLMRDRAGFLEFIDEARHLVEIIEQGSAESPAHLKRVVHTLKGNATIFGVQTLGDYCHQLETLLTEGEAGPSLQQRDELVRRFARLTAQVEAVVGGDASKRIEIERDEYEDALRGLGRGESRAVARRMAGWALEPTARRLERVAEQAQRIAERLNKAPLHVVIRDNGLRVQASKWSSFWSSFVHVIRNAIDHGIEPREERAAKRKPEQGTLEIATRAEKGKFVIEVGDDGRGLAWSTIEERAKQRGLPHASREELVAAIFKDGFSTAPFVTDYSGRGIGMGAVRAECEARGGKMEVVSSEGGGTRVVFSFPESAMAESPRADAA